MSQKKGVEVSARAARHIDGYRVLEGKREYVTYQGDSSIRIWYSDIPWRYETHDHSAVEIVLVLEGTVTYSVEGTSYPVRKADAHKQIRELLLRAKDFYEKQELMWNTACYSCILQVYATLGRHYLIGIRSRTGDTVRSMDTEVINAVMTYINDHYREDLRLDDVAGFSGFSRFYFSRSFKQQTGYSFKDYLCQKRLQAAMDLLTSTNLSMRGIAVESGFGSTASFNRAFRACKGCTPTQYRAVYGML